VRHKSTKIIGHFLLFAVMGEGLARRCLRVADSIRSILHLPLVLVKSAPLSHILLILAPNVARNPPLSDIEYSHLILIVFTHQPAQLNLSLGNI